MLALFVAMQHRILLMRHLRRMRELPLALVARETGINVSTVSQIERGLMQPTDRQRHTLAGFFGRPIDDLLGPVQEESVA